MSASLAEVVAAVEAAAARLEIHLTDYATGLERVQAASRSMEQRLAEAQAVGDLREFNQAYKERRVAAKIRGRPFISYGRARARLRTLLAAAASGRPVHDVMRQVFEP